jgi:hypothetical protein
MRRRVKGGGKGDDSPITELMSLSNMSSNLDEDLMLSLEEFNHLRGPNAMFLMTQSMRSATHLRGEVLIFLSEQIVCPLSDTKLLVNLRDRQE